MTTATATTTTRSRAVELSQSEWDTLRVALCCYASEQGESDNHYWAADIWKVYRAVHQQTT